MNEIHLTFYQFIPLVEAVYSQEIREQLKFLANGLETVRTIERCFMKKKEGEKPESIEKVFLPRYSNLKWSWYDDGYNYYRNYREIASRNQPIRPLVPLMTKSKKWKIPQTSTPILTSTKKAELSPILIGRIIKKIVIERKEKNVLNFFPFLKSLIQQCNKEKTNAKKSFLAAVFKDPEQIFVQDSDIISFIELNYDDYKKLEFSNQQINRLYHSSIELYVHDKKQVFAVYKEKKHKLLRKRVEKVVSLAFSLKFLIQRMLYKIDEGLLETLGIKEVSEILEFIISSLNPEIYSSREIPKLLPKHYQRMLFRKMSKELNLRKYYSIIQEKIQKKIMDMPAYDASYFFSRNNIFTNRLKDKVILVLAEEPEPELTEKDRLMLEFFVHQYKKEVEDDSLFCLKVSRKQILGSMSRNFIRINIKNWLENKGYPISTFTDNELKKSPVPDVIGRLSTKDLIQIDETEKGKTDLLLCLKEENRFVKKLLI
ncbi:MAG: hypothetical protein KGD64_03910 [Candidatus Heimdallarchaeota archaeon]|nr:hypothetical protein [Candidatus Heimdallarchaeota archaeon]